MSFCLDLQRPGELLVGSNPGTVHASLSIETKKAVIYRVFTDGSTEKVTLGTGHDVRNLAKAGRHIFYSDRTGCRIWKLDWETKTEEVFTVCKNSMITSSLAVDVDRVFWMCRNTAVYTAYFNGSDRVTIYTYPPGADFWSNGMAADTVRK